MFTDDMLHFTIKAQQMTQAALLNSCSAALASIQSGSPITGSPGQPVGQYGPGYHPGETGGALKLSWQMEPKVPTLDASCLISTDKVYAPMNEYGVTEDGRPYRQLSTVGGRASVRLTVAGWTRLVDSETAKLNG